MGACLVLSLRLCCLPRPSVMAVADRRASSRSIVPGAYRRTLIISDDGGPVNTGPARVLIKVGGGDCLLHRRRPDSNTNDWPGLADVTAT